MKILAQGKPNNNIAGFQPIAIQNGHTWIWWDENHTPAFDVFYEVKPDLFFGVGEVSRAVTKCLAKYGCPNVVQTGEFQYTINGEDTLSPSFLLDNINFQPALADEKYRSDVVCYGVSAEPDVFFMSLCGVNRSINVKLIGNYRWPLIEYAGIVNQAEKVSFINSANLVYCQTMTEATQALACAKIPVTGNQLNTMNKIGEMAGLCFDEPISFVKWCNETVGDDKFLSDLWTELAESIDFPGHTYENVYADIMEVVG